MNLEQFKAKQVAALDIRKCALALLRKAVEMDSKYPYIVVHHHQHGGVWTYVIFSDHEPSQEEIIKVLKTPFHPELGEKVGLEMLFPHSLLDLNEQEDNAEVTL